MGGRLADLYLGFFYPNTIQLTVVCCYYKIGHSILAIELQNKKKNEAFVWIK